MPALEPELALQLAGTERGHRAQRAQAEQVQALELLLVERELVRVEWCEEGARILDRHEATRACASRSDASGERSWGKAQPWFSTDGGAETAPCLTDRFARLGYRAHVQPRDALDPHLDCRSQVVKSGCDHPAQPRARVGSGQKKGRIRGEVLRLPQRHPRQHTEGQGLF